MNNYYVYAFLDTSKPGNYVYGEFKFEYEPYYIGKGSKERDSDFQRSKSVNYKTSKILESNHQPIIIRVFENLEEFDSIIKEEMLIKLIGTLKKGDGPLYNKNINTVKHFKRMRKSRITKRVKQTKTRKKHIDDMSSFLDSLQALAQKNN